jgi:hypothetical protein
MQNPVNRKKSGGNFPVKYPSYLMFYAYCGWKIAVLYNIIIICYLIYSESFPRFFSGLQDFACIIAVTNWPVKFVLFILVHIGGIFEHHCLNFLLVILWRSVLLVEETRVQVTAEKTTDLSQVTDKFYQKML